VLAYPVSLRHEIIMQRQVCIGLENISHEQTDLQAWKHWTVLTGRLELIKYFRTRILKFLYTQVTI